MSAVTEQASIPADVERCPACGQRIERLVAGNCALCGHSLVEPPVTSDDSTPYAQFLSGGPGGWWSMAFWLYRAGATRTGFVALMRASSASRRFARVGVFFAACSLALAAAGRAGWKLVSAVPIGPERPQTQPHGQGWYLLMQAAPRVFNEAPRADPTHLWWNPVASLTAAGCALLATAVLSWILIASLRGLTELSLRPEHRGEGRLSASIHYAWAWAAWLLPAGAIAAAAPLSLIGQLKREGPYPSEHTVYVVAVVIATVTALLAWFALVRSGATLPPASRGRVVAFYVIGAPLLVAALALAGGYGVWRVLDALYPALNVQW